MTSTTRPRPLGLWLRRVDALLTQRIDEVQAAHGLRRGDWQVLHALHDASPGRGEALGKQLESVLSAPELDAVLQHLVHRNWATASGAGVTLTAEGRQQHAALVISQKQVRQRAMRGISTDDYRSVITVLERMARNLDGTEGVA